MKITKVISKEFELHQKKHGTLRALEMIQWQIASALLQEVGVTRLRTTYAKRK